MHSLAIPSRKVRLRYSTLISKVGLRYSCNPSVSFVLYLQKLQTPYISEQMNVQFRQLVHAEPAKYI